MASFRTLLVLCLVPYCLGSAGGGHSGGSSSAQVASSEIPDNVVLLQVGKKFTLKCNTTKSDGGEFEYDWFKDAEKTPIEEDDRIKMGENGGELVYDPAEAEDVADYTCKARNKGPSSTYTVISISYKKLPKSGIAIEGDKLTLSCEAEGIPTPVITWTKDNMSIIDAVDPERLSFPESEKYPVNSTLLITDVRKTERGEYTCHITNYDGLVFSTSCFVRVKDIYAALWPFLGIVAEVVILCLVIFIYEKRRSKNDFEESDTDQGGST